jgi:acetolactate synthase regulatory subunit
VEGQLVRLTPNRTLKIAFCLPHANVTGGLKILLEQMRLLRQRGHAIVALTRSEVMDQAVPSWSDVAVDADVVCRLNQRFRDVYDVDSCDVVVTGIFHQVCLLPACLPACLPARPPACLPACVTCGM